jgi:hypothetical protein
LSFYDILIFLPCGTLIYGLKKALSLERFDKGNKPPAEWIKLKKRPKKGDQARHNKVTFNQKLQPDPGEHITAFVG